MTQAAAIVIALVLAVVTSASPLASSLQAKIDTIKKADANKGRRELQKLEVSEAELDAHVLIDLKSQIPVPMETFHSHITPGAIAANTRLTLPAGITGNFLVDYLVSGSHDFYFKGGLTGANGIGRFNLQEVTVDGIPVPGILVDALIRIYAKPRYPNADIKAPFILPWGIDAIEAGRGKGTVTY